MTTQISSDNIQAVTLATLGSGPTVTNVQITDSSYNVLDDTAVSLSGGYIKITGTNFASGCSVIINSTNATSVTFVSSTVLNVQVPTMAAGTYIVYVVNTDGGIAIRVNGLTYSGTPSWVTGSTLPQGSIDTAISIQLSATSDSTITYALQAGSSLPTGLTLSSSGLLSGTITGLSAETTYNFTITATDVELQDSPRSFSITITVGDQYWNYVSTLLSASAPTIMPFNDDASTNNFVVTINGDTRPNNFNPYTPGYYSAYFDGTGDYLTVPSNSNWSFAGQFTVEGWFYWNVTPASGNMFGVQSNGGFCLYNTGTALSPNIFGTGNVFTSTFFPSIGVWYHIAITRDSSNLMTMWVNGVSAGSATTSASYTTGTYTVGSANNTNVLQGYISNFRIVNGTALYTSNFTPPTAPLTAISGTSLLTCQSNTFVDNSTNNFTITRAGDTRISGFGPYTPNSSYSGYGSTYFDGTGDYLSLPSSSSFSFGTNNFTVEAWVYYNVKTNSGIFQIGSSIFPGTNGIGAGLDASTNWLLYYGNGSQIGAASGPVNGTWYHVATVRNSGVTKVYVNGTEVISVTDTTNYTGTFLGIGGIYSTSYLINGYISNFRVVKGTAVYTANFTPPTAPLTAITNTSLLTCQSNQPVNNNVFLDSSTNNFLVSRAGNTTQGTFSPYGENWSCYFDGTTDYLTVPTTTTFAAVSEDFTVECWVYKIGTTTQVICGWANSPYDYWLIESSGIGFNFNNTYTVYASTSVPLTQWCHIALSRSSGVNKIFVNGTQVGSNVTNTNSFGSASNMRIGDWFGTSPRYNWTGSLSNFRFVKGTALYTSNFTPSTTPLQPIANTALLTCKDPNIVDDSANNFTITRNGDVSVQKFGPFAGTTLPTPYYGAYFDGTGDYLTIPSNAAFQLGTGDYTFEAWIYPTALGSNNTNNIINIGDYTTGLLLRTAATTGVQIYTNGVLRFTTSTGLTANAWQHIALVRSGSTCTFYVNGSSIGTFTDSSSISPATATVTVGMAAHNSSEFFTGYMSSYRLVKGTAVYTSTFTPSTSPLTAISGTSLLICQSNTFIDVSTNNFTVTAFGNSRTTTYNPFTVAYSTKQSYTPSVFGGSMYFDGTGDYLEIPANTIFDFGSSNFTIECWVYPLTSGVLTGFISNWQTGGQFIFRKNTSNRLVFVYDPVSVAAVTLTGTTTTIITGMWNHVAVVRNGTTFTLYVNGIADATTSTSSAALEVLGKPLRIGVDGDAAGPMNGYISDVRITKGQALYTSNFVPQNRPLTSVTNTTLLLSGTSAGIYDSSEMNNFETVNDTKLSTATVKFSGTASLYFDGNGDYLVSQPRPTYGFGTGNFTIEFWVNFASTANRQDLLWISTAASDRGGILWNITAGKLTYYVSPSPGNAIDYTWTPAAGTWYHIALTRSNGTTRLFIDGVSSTTYSDTKSYSATNSLYLGTDSGVVGNTPFNGYISDLRITNGVARYTGNFTPPTTPFTPK